WCGMFHLEHRLDQEAFRIAVVPAKRQDFAEDAARWSALDMDDKIDSFSDLSFGVGEGCLRVVTHDQIGEEREGFGCRVVVERRERSRVAGIEGIAPCARLDATHDAQGGSVPSPGQS